MTTYGIDQPGTPASGQDDLKERAVDAVAEVDAGAMHVAGVAGQEAGNVAHEAKRAASGFFDETKRQVADQASAQQRRAADAVRTTGRELSSMAASSSSSGVATGLVRALGDQSDKVASWLEDREPGDLVREARTFARRHTGAFLAIAAGIGLVAGRLTKALMDKDDDTAAGSADYYGRRPLESGPAGMVGTTGVADDLGYGGTTGTTGLAGAGAGASAGMSGMPAAGGSYDDTPLADAVAADTGFTAPGESQELYDDDTAGADPWSRNGEERL